MASLEENGSGVQWSNIDTNVMGEFDMRWCMIFLLIDSAVYFLIGWYVRNVRPGESKKKDGIILDMLFTKCMMMECADKN